MQLLKEFQKRSSLFGSFRFNCVWIEIVKMTRNDDKPIMCYFSFCLLFFNVCQHNINCMFFRLIKMGLYRWKLWYCYYELAFVMLLSEALVEMVKRTKKKLIQVEKRLIRFILFFVVDKSVVWFSKLKPIKLFINEIEQFCIS